MVITVPVGRKFTLDPAYESGVLLTGVYALPAGTYNYFVDNNDAFYLSDDGVSTFVLPANPVTLCAPFIWGAGSPVTILLTPVGLRKGF